jgi:hypothetical protein
MNRNWIGLLVFLALPAMAQVYKCKDSNGKQVYSDIPCGGDAAPLQVKPARGTQPAEMDPNIARQMQDLRDREREEAREDARLRRVREANRPWDEYEARRKTERCSDLRRQLDTAEATLRNGAVSWQYNNAKASIPGLQNQIKRECR